ncbi:thiamine repressible gene regulatory protein thi1 [Colletotrichum incanum]|nr:thiamine repressible gene regulatory protein thi1 [Colletotrichum incanum]
MTIAEGTTSANSDTAAAIHRDGGDYDIKDDISTAASAPFEAFMWPRFLSRLRDAFCLDPRPASYEQDMIELQTRQQNSSSYNTAEIRRVRKALESFPPRAVADFLVSVCIAYGTDVFFYFDQAQFIYELDQFYSDSTLEIRLDTSFVCLSLAIFALGSQWTALAQPEDSDETSQKDNQGFDPGRIFYNQARVLIPDLIDRSCIRSVQATFILGVYLMPASAISASYVYMGLALRKALAIGLHQETDESTFSSEEKEARRRLWWSIYSLERTMSIKLNRPRSISQDIISVRLPRPISRDSVQKFDNVQHQIANITFVLIVDKLSQPGAWSRTSQTLSESDLSESLHNAQFSLKKWKEDLPPSISLQNVIPKSSSYRAVFHLHLNYYFASIDMGKVSVVTVNIKQSSDACIKAAKKMIDLFDGLSRSGNMARFSFTDFQGCSIATIIVLLAGILDRDSGYESRMAFGLSCLRRMACGGNATARMGVRFVEALQSITNEARCKLLATQPGQENKVGTSVEGADDYGRWADWLAKAEAIHNLSGDESELEHAEDSTLNLTTPLSLRHGMQPSTWNEAAALQLQELSVSKFALPIDNAEVPPGQHSVAIPSAEDVWMPSFTWSDDEMYLMGLTGMGVLDFTNLS